MMAFPISPDKLSLVIAAGLLALLFSLVLTPLAMRIAKRFGVMAKMSARRVHQTPTPMWGGLAIAGAFLLTVVILAIFYPSLWNGRVQGILLGGLLMTLVGAIDDKIEASAKLKIAGQFLAATILVLPTFGVRVITFGLDMPVVVMNVDLLPWLGALFTIIWVVGLTNALNYIDGLDGLAAGVAGIAALTFVVISVAMRGALGEALLAAALVGACVGFLRYNFNPARVFMGDAGSNFLGFTIAALSILQTWKVTTGIAFLVPILCVSVPIFDTIVVITRRMRGGLSLWKALSTADRGHLHHRMFDSGMSQRQVVLIIYLLAAIGCAASLLLAQQRLWH